MGTALVTGASSGLGKELALLLAGRGEEVVAVARNAAALDELVAASSRIQAFAADLTIAGDRDRLHAQFADVDILVNNAGFGAMGQFCEASRQVSDQMVEVNVPGAHQDLTARWLPGMVQRRSGRVLNVASTAAFQPGPLMAVYYASKAYVLSFTEAISEELRGTGVTATAFCPGAFSSGFQATAGVEGTRLIKGRRLPTSAQMASAAVAAMDRGATVSVPGAMTSSGRCPCVSRRVPCCCGRPSGSSPTHDATNDAVPLPRDRAPHRAGLQHQMTIDAVESDTIPLASPRRASALAWLWSSSSWGSVPTREFTASAPWTCGWTDAWAARPHSSALSSALHMGLAAGLSVADVHHGS